MFTVDAKIDDENKCTSFAGRFDGPADAPWQCRMHFPMEEVQGFGRSHWILVIGQVSTVYCPSGHQGHIQNNDDEKHTYFASHSDGHGDAPVSYCMHHSIEKVHRFNGSHWTPPSGEYLLQ
jgi:hypothetical protein